ncbi:MAG: phospholipase [Segetibacter sp.]|nr:phospholipase [Segetibacter sp.]
MVTDRDIYKKGHIIAKPTNDLPKENLPSGVYPTKLDGPRDAIIYVPEGYSVNRPASLAVMLHGAGGNQDHGMLLLRQYADEKNIILVSPASRAATWDIIYNDAFGPDVIFISQALIIAFERFAIDTKHVAIGGFSDGHLMRFPLALVMEISSPTLSLFHQALW